MVCLILHRTQREEKTVKTNSSRKSGRTRVTGAVRFKESVRVRPSAKVTARIVLRQPLLVFDVVLRQDTLEAILVIFGRRALIFFFCLKALEKKWKMTPLLCACTVAITLETQKCRKRALRSVEFNFFIICDRHKRFSQNERRRVDLQKFASDFFNFCLGT